MVQHAHRTARASVYTCLNVLILRVLLEDASVAKQLCNGETKMAVRLCRQRQPFLTLVKGHRVPACFILDIVVDGLTHNLQRRLDVDLYQWVACGVGQGKLANVDSLLFNVLLRIVIFLSNSRIRLGQYERIHLLLLKLTQPSIPVVRTLARRDIVHPLPGHLHHRSKTRFGNPGT